MPARVRKGFTVIELIVVIMIIGTIAMIGFPSVSNAVQKRSVQTGKQQLQSTISLARATAIQNGRFTRFVRTGNVVQAYIENGNQKVAVGPPVNLAKNKVSIETAYDTIRFDPRGFATGLGVSGNYQSVKIVRGSFRDSVCVSRFGRIASRGVCQ